MAISSPQQIIDYKDRMHRWLKPDAIRRPVFKPDLDPHFYAGNQAFLPIFKTRYNEFINAIKTTGVAGKLNIPLENLAVSDQWTRQDAATVKLFLGYTAEHNVTDELNSLKGGMKDKAALNALTSVLDNINDFRTTTSKIYEFNENHERSAVERAKEFFRDEWPGKNILPTPIDENAHRADDIGLGFNIRVAVHELQNFIEKDPLLSRIARLEGVYKIRATGTWDNDLDRAVNAIEAYIVTKGKQNPLPDALQKFIPLYRNLSGDELLLSNGAFFLGVDELQKTHPGVKDFYARSDEKMTSLLNVKALKKHLNAHSAENGIDPQSPLVEDGNMQDPAFISALKNQIKYYQKIIFPTEEPDGYWNDSTATQAKWLDKNLPSTPEVTEAQNFAHLLINLGPEDGAEIARRTDPDFDLDAYNLEQYKSDLHLPEVNEAAKYFERNMPGKKFSSAGDILGAHNLILLKENLVRVNQSLNAAYPDWNLETGFETNNINPTDKPFIRALHRTTSLIQKVLSDNDGAYIEKFIPEGTKDRDKRMDVFKALSDDIATGIGMLGIRKYAAAAASLEYMAALLYLPQMKTKAFAKDKQRIIEAIGLFAGFEALPDTMQNNINEKLEDEDPPFIQKDTPDENPNDSLSASNSVLNNEFMYAGDVKTQGAYGTMAQFKDNTDDAGLTHNDPETTVKSTTTPKNPSAIA